MPRSTRVLVLKAKDGEFVTVLRSGRRLWVESTDFNHRGDEISGDWCPLSDDQTKQKPTAATPTRGQFVSPDGDPMEIDGVIPFMESCRTTPRFDLRENRTFLNVYSRKRKRSGGNVSIDSSLGLNGRGDRMFGLHFVRRKRRKVAAVDSRMVVEQAENDHGLMISIAVEPSCASCGVFPRFLSSVLWYMSRGAIGVVEMSALFLSSSISPVFASSGIHFTLGRTLMQRTGICRIYGMEQFTPLFTVDFAAVPFCFLHLHATRLFRTLRLSCLCSIDFHMENEDTDINDSLSYINDHSDHSLTRSLTPNKDNFKGTKAVRSTSGVGRQGNRNVLYRTGVITRSRSKRRRRSLRNRKARNPLLLVLQKASESAVSNHIAVKKKASPPAVHPDQVLRNLARKRLSSEISVSKSCSLAMNVDVSSECCLANLLVVEIDKGYRLEGVEIVLDVSASNEWILAVKKDGLPRYSLKALRELRCNHITNHFTQALIWVAETGWKLEFPVRKDWFLFKELYKVCWEKNAIPVSPVVKIIPVPGVCEVINYWDSTKVPFKIPDSYIKMTSDELSIALSSRASNYDMDSEDEEWLSEFDNGLGGADLVSEETFELMIDAFEKDSYCRPEDCDDEKDAASLCHDLASSLVSREVYRYWVNKRTQNRYPLNRVFQFHQVRREQLITKPVLRKKWCLKRSPTRPIQCGRGKDSNDLQDIAVEEEYSDMSLEEANESAGISMEMAIAKRHVAQFLMENADLAVYRATMALRIADAAQNVESEEAVAHFLD